MRTYPISWGALPQLCGGLNGKGIQERGDTDDGASLVAQMVKNLPAMQKAQVWSLSWEEPLEKGVTPTPVLLSGEFHGQRSLVGCSPWGHKELDMT